MPDANGIRTTFEMDGLLTEEDIANRHFVMTRCIKCMKWTKRDKREPESGFHNDILTGNGVCEHCGHGKYDVRSACSVRSWNPDAKKARRKDERSQV